MGSSVQTFTHSGIRSWFQNDEKIQEVDKAANPWLSELIIQDSDSTETKVEKVAKILFTGIIFGFMIAAAHDAIYGEKFSKMRPIYDIACDTRGDCERMKIELKTGTQDPKELKKSNKSDLETIANTAYVNLEEDPVKAALFLRAIGQNPSRSLNEHVRDQLKSEYQLGDNGLFSFHSNQTGSSESIDESAYDQCLVELTRGHIHLTYFTSAFFMPSIEEFNRNPNAQKIDFGEMRMTVDFDFNKDQVTYSYTPPVRSV